MQKSILIYLILLTITIIGCITEDEDHYKLNTANDYLVEYSSAEDIVQIPLENTEALCSNGLDDDEDDLTDCDDEDCLVFVVCHSSSSALGAIPLLEENTLEKCLDGEDNDEDGDVDCDDEDCQVFNSCLSSSDGGGEPPLIPEDTYVKCSDNKDNDEDGLIDCEDDDCEIFIHCTSSSSLQALLPDENTVALCTNGIDDDEDGLIDCEDDECAEVHECVSSSTEGIVIPENTHARCTDGIDNDLDGDIDCEDQDCKDNVLECMDPPSSSSQVENTLALCSDNIDNDGDGDTDCDDEDCEDLNMCQSSSAIGGTDIVIEESFDIPGTVQFEDFVQPGLAYSNGWPFFETDLFRKDKENFPGLPSVSYPDEAADSNGVELQRCNGNGICLGFIDTQEMLSYVITPQNQTNFSLYVAAASNEPTATPPFGIAFYITNINLTETYYTVDTAIIELTNSWDAVQEFGPLNFELENTPDTLLLIFKSEGHPYNLDYMDIR